MSRTTITLKFKMCLFLDEASYWAEKLLTDINLPPLMPDADNNFGGSVDLDFRKWWRHVQAINPMTLSRLLCLGKFLQPRVGQVREIPKASLGFPHSHKWVYIKNTCSREKSP